MTSEWKDHVATRAQEIREMTDRREKVIEEFCENYTREIDRAQSRLNDIGEAQPNMTFGESGRGKSGILKPLAEEHTLPYFDCTMVEDVEIDLKKYWKATQHK
tara:strand:+ start:215 stop:523 length:309 start_codon:yes stop_codon:yes gene_type:complete